jgi:predicted secreted acid phosphatase
MKDASGKVVNGADIRKTMNEYINDGFLASLEPNQFTKEAIDIAQELGYKVFFLTARPKTQEKQTIVSLLKYNIKHDGVIYQKNKAWALNELSKGYDIVTFVDDNVGYIKDAAKLDFIGRVFVLSCPHNYNEDIPANVGRVTNLMEVVSTLRNLK